VTTVTCHTEGCGNEGQALDLDLTWTDEDGQERSVDAVVCGVCGHEITDKEGATA
jgi:uncharacterized CHY-type Zn-finger protein